MSHELSDVTKSPISRDLNQVTRQQTWPVREIAVRDRLENALAGVSEAEIRAWIQDVSTKLPHTSLEKIQRAAEVAKYGPLYYKIAQGSHNDIRPRIELTDAERDVSLAAFLQGYVQSSINAGSLFADTVGAGKVDVRGDWKLGAMNASPFLTAALIGAPLSLPVNFCVGRRGALVLSSILIIASSLGSAFSKTWAQVLGARVVGGLGMGIKAVSAPILASETAVGFWRGSTVLAWQLWVACGIMLGFVTNLVISAATQTLDSSSSIKEGKGDGDRYLAFQLILGAPLVPGLLLLGAVCCCYESPRFYMRPNEPHFDPERALEILKAIRKTELQAIRDLLLIWWPDRTDIANAGKDEDSLPDTDYFLHETTNRSRSGAGLTYILQLKVAMHLSLKQYRTLFETPRLRNAVWSTCIVALAQQLCGVNVFAFYSNNLFSDYGRQTVEISMAYTLGFGAVNFLFALPAMRSIDTFGRRGWLLSTLPIMALCLMASAVAFASGQYETPPGSGDVHTGQNGSRLIVGIVFIYLFAVAYSPGLGPIPFTLASESFPLSHREAGASVAISINLLFAGVLTILLPKMSSTLQFSGTLGFFSGMNIVAFILVFLMVEETKQLSLEELDAVYENPKWVFVSYQFRYRLPYYVKRFLLRRDVDDPQDFDDYALELRETSKRGNDA